MDERLSRLLLETLRREDLLRERVRPTVEKGDYWARWRDANRMLQHDDEIEYGPAWSSTDWFAAWTSAEQMAWSRTLKAARQAGLIEATTMSGRVHYIRLTELGREQAEALRHAATKG